MDIARNSLQSQSLSDTLRDMQREMRLMFNENTEFPSHGLSHTLFRRRNRVIEKASDLLNRSARLMLIVCSHEQQAEPAGHDVNSLTRRVHELKENWRSLRNEDSDLMMESLVVDLGTGD